MPSDLIKNDLYKKVLLEPAELDVNHLYIVSGYASSAMAFHHAENLKAIMAHYVDDVDLVGFLRLETFVMTDDNKKAKARTSGERILQCTTAASSISKNRMGIVDDITVQFGINPLVNYINNIGE